MFDSTFTLLSQSCQDYNAAVNVNTPGPHHLHCGRVSLVALSMRRDPNSKSGVIQGWMAPVYFSAVTSLMACLRLVSDVQLHPVMPQDIKFGMNVGGTEEAGTLGAAGFEATLSFSVK